MNRFQKFYLENIEQLISTRKRQSMLFVMLLVCLLSSFFIYRSSYSQRRALSDLLNIKQMQQRVKKLTDKKEILKTKFSDLSKKAQKADLTTTLEALFKSAEVEFKSEWNAKLKNTPIPLQSGGLIYQSLELSVESVELKKLLTLLDALSKSKEVGICEIELLCAEGKFTVNLTAALIREKS